MNFSNFKDILNNIYFGNTLINYILFLILIITLIILFFILKKIILVKMYKLAKKTQFKLDDILIEHFKRIKIHSFIIIAVYFASRILKYIPNFLNKIIYIAFVFALSLEIIKIVNIFVDFFAKQYSKKESATHKNAAKMLAKMIKIAVYIIVILLLIQNNIYDITPIFAGLGIGGIAIAFALQNILSDFFSSASIYFDKPFEKNEFIRIDGNLGKVKKIGIKTTRINTLEGEEMIVSNNELTNKTIYNYNKMNHIRKNILLGVEYETSMKKLKKIPIIIKEILKKNGKKVNIIRIVFDSFGDFALIFKVSFTISIKNYDSDYSKYAEICNNINYEILEAFEKHEINFAYPTQKILLENLTREK